MRVEPFAFDTILTEDLADGSVLLGVRILNPFAGSALAPQAATLLADNDPTIRAERRVHVRAACQCPAAACYTFKVPRITGTQLPATVASTGPSPVFRAEAIKWLLRPISTPCSMS